MKKIFISEGIDADRFIYGSPDSTALLYLLLNLSDKIKLLVGHSKGNYSIENALEGWVVAAKKSKQPIPKDMRIVTLGAVVRFPPEFKHVYQFLGSIDGFGWMNSRYFVDRETMNGDWHSLNTALWGHLSVDEALKQAGL